MPRAQRYYIPGYVWHITHRCHKREYLLKFARDRRRWLHWLYEAKKRYGLCVLNYMVTSNHIHLLLFDSGHFNTIPKSIQLIAGRTAQEYNQRKSRKGSFWQDRYHATAVESGEHLRQCIVYIDLNMVRSGAVSHPREWEISGYNEIQNPKQRYAVIDHEKLKDLAYSGTDVPFRSAHASWIKDALRSDDNQRQQNWSESIAVGGKAFIDSVEKQLGYRARGHKNEKTEAGWVFREQPISYKADFYTQNALLSHKNTFPFNNNP